MLQSDAKKKTVAHDATSATCKHFSSKLLVDKYSKSSLGTFGTSVVLWWEISLTAPKRPSSLLRVVFPKFGWWFLRAQRRWPLIPNKILISCYPIHPSTFFVLPTTPGSSFSSHNVYAKISNTSTSPHQILTHEIHGMKNIVHDLPNISKQLKHH